MDGDGLSFGEAVAGRQRGQGGRRIDKGRLTM